MDQSEFGFIPHTCLGESSDKLHHLEQVITLAVEIAREGREGKKVGTIFTVFNAEEVVSRSRCMILDPLALHDDHKKQIDDPNLRETIKELSLLIKLETGWQYSASCAFLVPHLLQSNAAIPVEIYG
jgi:hypothetical protein